MAENTFTLDDIRAAAEKKYGATNIPLGNGRVCKLLNPLRLSKENRAALMAKQDELESEDADQEAILSDSLKLVAENANDAKALLKELGGDLAMLAIVFEKYNESTQLGEASSSQD
ncbi:phage tail assembly protein [Kribbella sp. NBC_01505]|uniref:phage tail assembly protein n=1 Tax=Kribbella sp. NBC_01505 TaxID=2903580 RepID=UPI00386B9544